MVIQLDGFGSPEQKLAKYRELHAVAPFFSGFKLFLQQDTRLMDPAEVRALDPAADLHVVPVDRHRRRTRINVRMNKYLLAARPKETPEPCATFRCRQGIFVGTCRST